MNKKGFTMTELIVSIAIIAVVMIFLVNLLVDIRYDKKNELYDTKNQINRAEIIKTIQNDLLLILKLIQLILEVIQII